LATIGAICDHEPSQAGINGDGFHRSLGGLGQPPHLAELLAVAAEALHS
jgi:hypothetical protein